MALTQVSRGLLSTSIVDNGNATAITIDSSENVGIGTSSFSEKLTIAGDVQIGESSGGEKLKFVGASGKYNFLIGKQVNVDNALEITPSTAAGGNTFSTPAVVVNSSGNVGIGVSSVIGKLHANDSGGATVTLTRTSGATSGNLGKLQFGNTDIDSDLASIAAIQDGATNNSALTFGTQATGAAVAERMRIDSSGDLNIVNTGQASLNYTTDGSLDYARITGGKSGSGAGDLRFFTYSGGIAERMRINSVGDTFFGINSKTDTPSNGGVYIAGDNSVGSTNSYAQVFVIHNSVTNHGIILKELNSGGGQALQFLNSSATLVGSIATSASATAYNTSSDYRLKENVVAMTGATERLKQLNPSRFNFIADADVTVDGFLAHEVQDIVPEAITGTKDAVDDDGNAVYQGIDQSKLVPLLVATIQELEARITQLENN